MNVMGKLFGSMARVRLLRLVLFNRDTKFTLENISYRTKVPKDIARREVNALMSIGLLKKQKAKIQGKNKIVYKTNTSFEHFEALKTFFRQTTDLKKTNIVPMLKKCGVVKLLILSGSLTGVQESAIDILIVGDKFNTTKVDRAMRRLEAEIGQELSYALFSTQDFTYRLGVYDRLLRDTLEYDHVTLVDKLGVT